MMRDAMQSIKRGDAEIDIIGIDDPTMLHRDDIESPEIIRQEIVGVGHDGEKYAILLSHRPEMLDVYAETGMDLALTGHAHGGQIIIPFVGGLYAPDQGFFPKFTSGVHTQGDTTLIISRGIGATRFPFRINNRPELVTVELKAS